MVKAHNIFESKTPPKRPSQTSKSKRQKPDLEEAGDFIECRLFGRRENTMGDSDARWILNFENWSNQNVQDGQWFGQRLQEIIQNDKKRLGSSKTRLNFTSHLTVPDEDKEHYPNRLDMGKCGVRDITIDLARQCK